MPDPTTSALAAVVVLLVLVIVYLCYSKMSTKTATTTSSFGNSINSGMSPVPYGTQLDGANMGPTPPLWMKAGDLGAAQLRHGMPNPLLPVQQIAKPVYDQSIVDELMALTALGVDMEDGIMVEGQQDEAYRTAYIAAQGATFTKLQAAGKTPQPVVPAHAPPAYPLAAPHPMALAAAPTAAPATHA